MLERLFAPLTLLSLAAFLASGAAAQSPPDANSTIKTLPPQEASDVIADAQMRVNDAVPIIEKMKADPHASELLTQAKDVVIVPHYLQAALVLGGRSGAGLLPASDVVVWSDTKGLFGGAAVGASKVTRDTTANQTSYNNRDVTAQQILSGAVTNPHTKPLLDAMPPPQAQAAKP